MLLPPDIVPLAAQLHNGSAGSNTVATAAPEVVPLQFASLTVVTV